MVVHHPRVRGYLSPQTQLCNTAANTLSSTAKRRCDCKCRWKFLPFSLFDMPFSQLIIFSLPPWPPPLHTNYTGELQSATGRQVSLFFPLFSTHSLTFFQLNVYHVIHMNIPLAVLRPSYRWNGKVCFSILSIILTGLVLTCFQLHIYGVYIEMVL